jgi:hydroxymethylglutaryl-CoA reductase (NADPH)
MKTGRLFRAHGEFCASHPWEVIVALITFTACMLSVDNGKSSANSNGQTTGDPMLNADSANIKPMHYRQCHGWRDSCDGFEAQYIAADVILMTIVRCSAVLYCYYQFCNLHKLGSKYILGIAGLFTVFSSFIFTSSIMNFLKSDISDLKDALFFFLLLIDLSKAGILAKLALCGSNSKEVTQNIARGMEILGPAISLDTLVEALVIGVGTLSGVQRLETLSGFAVISVIVNYVVFMTFYPACLSLTLDLSRGSNDTDGELVVEKQTEVAKNKIKDPSLLRVLSEEDQKQNPIVQRVKLIMSSGLMIVHAHSRLTFSDNDVDDDVSNVNGGSESKTIHMANTMNKTEPSDLSDYIMRWLSISTEQIVILILLLTLCVKFIFFDRDDLADQLQKNLATAELEERKRKRIEEETKKQEALVQQQQQQQQQIQSENPPPQRHRPIFSISENSDSTKDVETQTDPIKIAKRDATDSQESSDIEDVMMEMMPKRQPRSLDECIRIMNSDEGAKALTDDEVIMLIDAGRNLLPLHRVEGVLEDPERGVKIRRRVMSAKIGYKNSDGQDIFDNLSYKNYNYSKVMNACCENVLGYVEIPVGYAGPLILDGAKYYVPMATTEGALVASTNRGCKALSHYGIRSIVEDVGMTRAPCVKFPDVLRAAQAKRWMETPENFQTIKLAFDSTSRFARLQELLITMDGPQLYVRFRAFTGDAMGMNMVSKGAEMALRIVQRQFSDMQIISLSGNFCSDKKPAAINWIKGRGKRVVCEARVSEEVLRTLLKTDAKTLVQCNKLKNMAGSAMAGSIGGNNAHAANMVTAIFIATGQDPAQNITSSNCSTQMELHGENSKDLYITCTMPSLEVGTVGGGTVLPGQSTCLEVLGVRGAHQTHPAENSKKLARIICATVMAGELSLMAALVNSDLVKSHMKHNRSSAIVNPSLSLSSFSSSQNTSSLRPSQTMTSLLSVTKE